MNEVTLSHQLDEIESELKRVGLFGIEKPEVSQVTSAFGYGQMAFEQWLVHVFLPNARQGVKSGVLPPDSQVATAAMRHFDGDDEMAGLVSLLAQFDQSVRNHAAARQGNAGSRRGPGLFARFFGRLFGKGSRRG